MVMDAEEQATLNKTIYAAQYLAATLSGEGVWGVPVEGKARVEPSNAYLRTSSQGEDITSTWQLFTQMRIAQNDRVWIPIGENPANPNDPTIAHQVKQVDTLYDDDGTLHHYEVML